MEKEPPVTLYHRDNKNGTCIALVHDSGDLFELFMAKILHGKCPDLCRSDMKGITRRELVQTIESAQSSGKKVIKLQVKRHVGELDIKRVEKYLLGIKALIAIQSPVDTNRGIKRSNISGLNQVRA